MAKREMKTINTEAAEETTVEEPVEEMKELVPIFGVVTGCSRLNVRKEAKKDADVVTIVNAGAKLVIDTDCKSKKWYKVTTKDGKDGYCMKEFITIDE